MRDGHAGQRGFGAMTAVFLLSLSSVPDAAASEWDTVRERQRDALKAAEGRIADIEAKERVGSADPEKLADKITRDRIGRAMAALKSGESGRLGDTATRVSREATAPTTGYEGQDAHVAAAMRDWEANGAERRKLRESRVALERNLELVELNLTSAIEAVGAAAARWPEAGVLEALARVATAVSEARERLGARWQREHAARERERRQREREEGERARGVR